MSGAQSRLLPANANLYQPNTQYYRLNNALALLNASAVIDYNAATQATANSQQAAQMTAMQNQIDAQASQISGLQSQIDTINQRLANAGIP